MFGKYFESSKVSASDLPSSEISSKKRKGGKQTNVSNLEHDGAIDRKHPSVKGKKRRKRKQLSQNVRKKLSFETLELSKRLKECSRNKSLQEALELYKSNEEHADSFHACILVDCCARCGAVEEAEQLVKSLDKHKLNVEVNTALMKAFAHSGRMSSAIRLFRSMMADPKCLPNVRTLNTLLRGCLWSASMYVDADDSKPSSLVGGVVTSEEAWTLFKNSIGKDEFDSSSYEYSIALLCQALRCDEATTRIEEYMTKTKIRVKGKASVVGGDQESLEVLAHAYLGVARAEMMRGATDAMWMACQRCLSSVKASQKLLRRSSMAEEVSTSDKERGKMRKVDGGKRAFATSGSKAEDDLKRLQSNQLYRSHRLNEIETDALHLIKMRKQMDCLTIQTGVAKRLLYQLFYFSGGGTTELPAPEQVAMSTSDKISLAPSWLSFGLSQLVQKHHARTPLDRLRRKDILQSLSVADTAGVIRDGKLQLKEIFPMAEDPVDIELGAGFGEWVASQALANQNRNYIAVELRADRVSQIFARGVTSSIETASCGKLGNLCVVGDDSCSFLQTRIAPNSVSQIFVNHPEPPTQTYGEDSYDVRAILNGGNEPAHMMNSSTCVAVARCLKPGGRLCIVTDNRRFARLMSATLSRTITHGKAHLESATARDLNGFKCIEVFGKNGSNQIELLEGQPNSSIGHMDTKKGGATYFDRLWRSGAGSHSETTQRFVLVVYKRNSRRE